MRIRTWAWIVLINPVFIGFVSAVVDYFTPVPVDVIILSATGLLLIGIIGLLWDLVISSTDSQNDETSEELR